MLMLMLMLMIEIYLIIINIIINYIRSGARMPISPNPSASTVRIPRHSISLAAVSPASSPMTRCLA
jgi:hypothetical protein